MNLHNDSTTVTYTRLGQQASIFRNLVRSVNPESVNIYEILGTFCG